MKQTEEAQRLKEERARNERIINMQKEQELMKNNNVKEMIRQQKMMAEERKEMVSIFKCFY
jgi:ribosomal protein L17